MQPGYDSLPANTTRKASSNIACKLSHMKKTIAPLVFAALAIAALPACKQPRQTPLKADLELPQGFAATIIADSVGAARHMAVTSNGAIYVKLNNLKNGKGIYRLSDPDGDGVFDQSTGFGNYPGTGIGIQDGYLYASSNTGVYRYKLSNEQYADTTAPEKIVDGLVARKQDAAKAIVLDNQHNLYVAICSYSDAARECAGKVLACPLLDSVGGIWQFKADKTNQTYADGTRYATGLKSVVGFAWNTSTNSLFALQHGRGQFDDLYPQYFTPEYSAKFPAETMYELTKGSDAGWPYVYYDHINKKKLLAPEFGGDGKKTGGENTLDPIVAFPAHLGPNDLLFYTGTLFPEKYRNGAFIAFHNQSQELHKGFFVAFVPFKNGKPSGDWEIFASNFAGIDLQHPKGSVQHRPCGLAQAPDGSLYVADDMKGTIYRITYNK